MKGPSRILGLAIGAALLFAGPAAHATLVFDESIDREGQGFGAIENILTFESEGGAGDSNSGGGGIEWDGSGDAVFDEFGDLTVDVNPIKSATFTFGMLGLTSASQIVVIWDPAEQGGAETTSVDMAVITIYAPDGSVLWSSGESTTSDSSFTAETFTDTVNPGTGGNGFGFRLDMDQANSLQAALDAVGDYSMYRIGLYAEHDFLDNGPDTWLIGSQPGQVNVPEPASLALLGMGLVGLAGARLIRRRA